MTAKTPFLVPQRLGCVFWLSLGGVVVAAVESVALLAYFRLLRLEIVIWSSICLLVILEAELGKSQTVRKEAPSLSVNWAAPTQNACTWVLGYRAWHLWRRCLAGIL